MRRESRFVMSHKPYAVDLSSLAIERRTGYQGREYFSGSVRAVWFRRRRRGGYGPQGTVVTVACIGTLSGSQDAQPKDGREFVERLTDGRWGGNCEGRWDGSGYWSAESPDVMAEHLAILRPMLDGYTADPKNPALSAPFEGWWRF